MSNPDDSAKGQFLRIAEAARRLGVSRMRVREEAARGRLASRRDNEGRLRVDLGGATEAQPREEALAGPELMELLFDEIEELNRELDDERAGTERLSALVERQDDALGRAERGLEGAGRLEAMLERALRAGEAGGGAEAAERAMEMLDRALGAAEAARADAARLGALLERSMAAGERLEGAVARRDEMIEKQSRILDRALTATERAAGLAGPDGRPKRGFWDRLKGR